MVIGSGEAKQIVRAKAAAACAASDSSFRSGANAFLFSIPIACMWKRWTPSRRKPCPANFRAGAGFTPMAEPRPFAASAIR